MAQHKTLIDHVDADTLDTEAWSAYCRGCDWQGDWHHPDSFAWSASGISPADQAQDQAVADGEDHTESAED